ncbi:MAG: PssD/Cps14F family polysaccharide biosynthesis glycosyltransferase [Varibaculum cambriense]|nr:PssD/Cps14F family polysaccharide biosynthesis glycosyltransferase [Varibaculum cambriense]
MVKILFAGSSGGHLAQLYTLKPWWEQQQTLWVTFDTPDATSLLADQKVVWAKHSPDRNLHDVFRSLRLAWKLLRSARPELVVSAGASLGTVFIVLARLMKIPTIYIEVFDRIEIPSLSGKICYRVADRFAVQWPEQLKLYPGATVIGPLL